MHAEHAGGGNGRGGPRILVDLADGRLTDDEADTVVAWIMTEDLDDVPPWVVNRAVRIAGHAMAGHVPWPTPWRRLVAALVYDTRLHLRPAGAHPADLDHPRLLYAVGGVEINLKLDGSALAGRVRVLGHLAANAPDLAGAWVAMDGPSGHREATVDELGQFSLDRLATGAHCLHLGLADELIEISELCL